MQKNPIKKDVCGRQCRRRSTCIAYPEKKIMEMEKELQTPLKLSALGLALDELKEMQRKIRAPSEKNFTHRKKDNRPIVEGISIFLLIGLVGGAIIGILYMIGVDEVLSQ